MEPERKALRLALGAVIALTLAAVIALIVAREAGWLPSLVDEPVAFGASLLAAAGTVLGLAGSAYGVWSTWRRERAVASLNDALVEALFYGYRVNFLDHVLKHYRAQGAYLFLIAEPDRTLLEDADYIIGVKQELAMLGFEMVAVPGTEGRFRNVYTIYEAKVGGADAPAVAIDVPTTLRTLRKTIEINLGTETGHAVPEAEIDRLFTARRAAFFGHLDRWIEAQGVGDKVRRITPEGPGIGALARAVVEEVRARV